MSQHPAITPHSSWEIELAEIISMDGLIELERAFGGRFIYIHSRHPSLELQTAIGHNHAVALTDWYGGTDIYVPMVALKQLRNRSIEAEARAMAGNSTGKTVIELAAKFRLSTRRIITILKERGLYGNTGR